MTDRERSIIGAIYLVACGIVLGLIGYVVNDWLRDQIGDYWADPLTAIALGIGALLVVSVLVWVTPDPLDNWLGEDEANKNRKG